LPGELFFFPAKIILCRLEPYALPYVLQKLLVHLDKTNNQTSRHNDAECFVFIGAYMLHLQRSYLQLIFTNSQNSLFFCYSFYILQERREANIYIQGFNTVLKRTVTITVYFLGLNRNHAMIIWFPAPPLEIIIL
jgi:hypothetical protein